MENDNEFENNNFENPMNIQKNELPKEYRKFNWGAFFLTWIWGLGNKTYITFWAIPAWILSMYVPLLHLAVSVWFGVQGNKWAWENKFFENIDEFQNKQKTWAIWGTIIGIGFTVLKCAMVMLFAMLLFLAGNKNGSIERIQKTSPACIEYQTYKNNPEFSMNRIVKYRKVKNACGEDIFFGILEEFSADD